VADTPEVAIVIDPDVECVVSRSPSWAVPDGTAIA